MDRHTDRQTHTKVTTVGTLSGFQDYFLQHIIKDRPNNISFQTLDGKIWPLVLNVARDFCAGSVRCSSVLCLFFCFFFFFFFLSFKERYLCITVSHCINLLHSFFAKSVFFLFFVVVVVVVFFQCFSIL